MIAEGYTANLYEYGTFLGVLRGVNRLQVPAEPAYPVSALAVSRGGFHACSELQQGYLSSLWMNTLTPNITLTLSLTPN